MALPVYSVEFAHQEVPVGPTPFYTVPDGFVAVLRDIDGIGPVNSDAIILSEAIANLNYFALAQTVVNEPFDNQIAVYQWRGRQVFTAGQEMQWGCALPLSFARACGYLLTAS